MTEYSYAGLRELREALDKKKVSPSELAKYFLGRMERAATLNAFISVLGDQLLEGAAACESSSEKSRESSHSSGLGASLHGIPIAIKDIILHVGSKTTAASKILSNFDSPYDATVTTKLKSAGALIAGKTNLDEFAMGSSNENSAYGVVKNPWNTAFVPGGSSGGSAAAVAAGLVPGALGTDTGGSIRQPAALCGIVGIKPTYGRVSRYGIVAFASSLDQVGVFARSSFDAAWLLETISGHCRNDSTSVSKQVPSWRSDVALGVRGLRIGIPKEYFIPGMSAEVESSVRAAIQTLTSLGATAVEISLPHTEAAVAVYYVLAPAEASSNLARYDGVRYGFRAADCTDLKELYVRSRSEGFGPEVKRRIMVGTYVLSTGYYDAYYLRAQKVRRLIAKDFQDAFETCDVIACPASPTAAFRIGEKAADPMAMYLSDVFTIPVNLAGLPGMSIPCGLTSDNLPIGLQLIGRPWDESALFRVAGAYETATDWHTRRPPQNWLQ